jgi:hypothetical protein
MITGRRLFAPSAASPLAVLASICAICGTPTEDEWPGIDALPDSGRIRLLRPHQTSLRETLGRALPEEFHLLIPLFEKMLQMDPGRRISVDEVAMHQFFNEEVQLPPIAEPECHAIDVARKTPKGIRKIETSIKPVRIRVPPVLA